MALFTVLVFGDMVSPRIFGWSGTHFVEWTGQELRDLPTTAPLLLPQGLGLKTFATTYIYIMTRGNKPLSTGAFQSDPNLVSSMVEEEKPRSTVSQTEVEKHRFRQSDWV